MKVQIVYEADGTQSMTVEGPHIATMIRRGGIGMVIVRDELDREIRCLHFSRVYLMDKERS